VVVVVELVVVGARVVVVVEGSVVVEATGSIVAADDPEHAAVSTMLSTARVRRVVRNTGRQCNPIIGL
jgi:nucleoside diphosphate kinase